MWQQEKKDSAIASLALWLALAATPLATTMLMSTPATAEPTADTPAFPLPPNVENGTVVKIDGSSSFQSINQGLKNNFEQQFSGTKVELANNGTEAALKALLDGQIDIAAIARELTPAEKAQGLEAISLQPEKIAIVVGANNPFKGSLTTRQFAKIFRGEIQDWSELGAKAGKIRFIDHPATSDTRTALRNAPVFEKGEFTTGANAIQVSDNNPAEIIKQLDKDGISYVLANQISQIVSDVRVIKVEKSGIDNPKYPFSQPLVYVYKQNPSPGVAAFLGFTSAQPGQKAIEAARNQEAKAIAASTLQSFTTVSAATPITATGETTPAATPAPAQAPPVNSGIEQNSTIGNNSALNGVNTPWLMVLPLFLIAVLGGFLPWWLLKRKRSPDENTENPTENNINLPVSTTHPSEDNIEPSIVSSSAATDTISNLHQGATTDEVIPSEAPASGVAVLTAKKTNVVDDISNAETELSTLDGGEVVWDIEAPVAVVNNLYPQIPNRPEMTFDIELSTDEFIGPASELTDELVEESISELNNPLLKLPDIADTSNSDINSLSELLEASAQTNADLLDNTAKTPTEASLSLSELLDASAKASTEDSLSLSNLLEETTETPTEASQSLSELLDASAKASTEDSLSLSDLLDNTAKTSTEASLSLSQLLDATAKASTEDSLTEISDLPETSAPTSSEESTISEFLDNASDFVDHYIAADEVPTSLPDTAAQTSNEESTISDVLDQNSDFLDDYITSDDVLAFQPYTIIESSDDALAELPEELGQALDALMDDSAATLSDNATITDDFALPDEIEDSLPDLPEELGQVLDALVDNSTVALSDLPDTSDESENLTFDLDESLNVKDSSTEAEELTFDVEDALTEAEDLTFDVEDSSTEAEDLTFNVEDALTEAEDLTFDVEDSSTEAGDLTFGVEDALTEAEDLTFNVEDSSTEANDANLELEDAFAQANDSTLELEDAFAQASDSNLELEDAFAQASDANLELEDTFAQASDANLELEDTFAQASNSNLELEDSFGELPDTSDETEDLTFEEKDSVAQLPDNLDETEDLALIDETIDSLSELPVEPELSVETITNPSEITVEDAASVVNDGLVAWTNLEREEQSTAAEEQEQTTITQAAELLDIDDGTSNIVLTPRTPKWAYVSWYVSENVKQAIRNKGDYLLAVRLYDVTNLDLSYQLPQLVQQYECEEATSDRYVAIPTGNRDYIAEIGFSTKNGSWLCLARSSAIRVFSRPRTDFWFVTDTELVIHGATEPGAKVTVAGNSISVKTDGTFEVRVPFINDSAEYQLTATAPTGGKIQTIVKKFSQETR